MSRVRERRWIRRHRGVERDPGARVAGGAVLLAEGPDARIVLGPKAVVGAGCHLQATGAATIRVDGELGEGCRVVAREEVVVAAGARLGTRCALIDFDHVAEDVERPVRTQGLRTAPVHVGAGAILGPGVVVLRGATVGAGATVLAGSVVTRDIAPGTRAAGTPARSEGCDGVA